jgi:2-polyprenyl-3-methyl-5-hydroxy-6-metoxy-1,4-benzoquinol methylase
MGETEIALAHGQLSARQLAEGAYGPALESITTALRLAPAAAPLWAQFSDLIRYFNLRHPVPPLVHELLSKALEHPAVDPGNLVLPITTLALSRSAGTAFEEPLLLRMLEDVVIRDAALERLITDTRRRMLDEVFPIHIAAAIAHQCFNTEYVFDETAEEKAKVERLRSSLGTLHSYAAYAAYRSLGTANDVKLDGTPLASLARRQIIEPMEEQRLAAELPSLDDEKSSVSAAVRAQYEANPYPRWVRMQSSFAAAPLAQIVRELFPQAEIKELSRTPRILVAGCGTGQNAIATAQRFAGASVLAVDLSRASLGYARRKTLELGLENIEYRQADILALGALDERFDLIECSGVLHHLEDPFEGWRILAALRKPGGLMRVGLYSESGRRTVTRARDLIAARGFAPDAEGIRACRAAIRNDPSLAQIARNEDFYSMSGCRDLLFHVHEQRFSLPQVEAMIARLGLRFLGFEFPDSGATLSRYRAKSSPDSNLANWHRFEQEFPDTFARMYQFWVQGTN